jgi:soluble P-type ATPase
MMTIRIPGRKEYKLKHLVLDVNGTIALDGSLLPGVAERLQRLSQALKIHLLTADTHGQQDGIDKHLGIKAQRIPAGDEAAAKGRFIENLGAEITVAIGNGSNDALLLKRAGLSIAVLGPEGLSVEALKMADAVAGDINSALDLLLHPQRLVATLRQ